MTTRHRDLKWKKSKKSRVNQQIKMKTSIRNISMLFYLTTYYKWFDHEYKRTRKYTSPNMEIGRNMNSSCILFKNLCICSQLHVQVEIRINVKKSRLDLKELHEQKLWTLRKSTPLSDVQKPSQDSTLSSLEQRNYGNWSVLILLIKAQAYIPRVSNFNNIWRSNFSK